MDHLSPLTELACVVSFARSEERSANVFVVFSFLRKIVSSLARDACCATHIHLVLLRRSFLSFSVARAMFLGAAKKRIPSCFFWWLSSFSRPLWEIPLESFHRQGLLFFFMPHVVIACKIVYCVGLLLRATWLVAASSGLHMPGHVGNTFHNSLDSVILASGRHRGETQNNTME